MLALRETMETRLFFECAATTVAVHNIDHFCPCYFQVRIQTPERCCVKILAARKTLGTTFWIKRHIDHTGASVDSLCCWHLPLWQLPEECWWRVLLDALCNVGPIHSLTIASHLVNCLCVFATECMPGICRNWFLDNFASPLRCSYSH